MGQARPRTYEEIQVAIDHMLADERLARKPRRVDELALIQLDLQSRINALRWSVGDVGGHGCGSAGQPEGGE